MTEMKEMVYEKDRKKEVLYSGEYKGYKFAILSLGVHPTAYVENKNGFYEYDEANEKTYNQPFPHGGFTYLGECHWDDSDKTEYLGWDYAHCGDFAGYDIGNPDPYWANEKRWTTAEIYEDIKKTIDFLSGISGDLTDEQIEMILACCGKRKPDCEKCPYNCDTYNRRCYRSAEQALAYINRLKEKIYQLEQNLGQCENGYKQELFTARYDLGEEKQARKLAETQLRELLSALYKQTDNEDKSFTLYQSDVVEIAKDYKITEEELK